MKESLYGLLNLQEVDNDIDELYKHKSDYPARIEELKSLIKELQDDRQAKEEHLAEQEANFRHFHQQQQTAEEDLKKHQNRMLEIKTNREYDALQQEIMALQHAIDEYLAERDKADEEVRKLKNLLTAEKDEVAAKIAAYEAEIADLQEKTRTIDDEVAKTRERRKQAAAQVPARVVDAYERVRRGKHKAVVRVVRGACGGCWRSLPPQRLNELRMSKRIIVCDGCGRILVWDDRDNNSSPGNA